MKLESFALLFRAAAEKGILLLLGMLAAIALCNSSYSSIYHAVMGEHISINVGKCAYISLSLRDWINDFAMALFFMVVGMEIKREMIDGHLATWSQRFLPFVAATAGVLLPMAIFMAFNWHSPDSLSGWAIPAATDIAFALAMFAMFARGLPLSLRVFLAALAIIDDLMAVVIIAIFYTANLAPIYLLNILIIALTIAFLWRLGYKGIFLYLVGGLLLWYCFYRSGVHATVSGVVMGFLIPLRCKKIENFSPLLTLEKILSPYISYLILPVFAFANSGIDLRFMAITDFQNSITMGVMLGLFIGKQVGVFGSVWLMTKINIARLPSGSNYQQFYCVSILCGIGFTMSLFINILAYSTQPAFITSAQLGVLAGSALSALWGAIMLYIIRKIK